MASEYSDLFELVLGAWSDLEAAPEPRPGEPQVATYSPFGRAVFPAAIFANGDFPQS